MNASVKVSRNQRVNPNVKVSEIGMMVVKILENRIMIEAAYPSMSEKGECKRESKRDFNGECKCKG